MPAPVVFFDIAGPDSAELQKFYNKVFDWEIDDSGKFSVNIASPLEATFRSDPTEKLLYFGVPDINTAMTTIEANGGSVDVPRFEVPGVVIIGLFKDPAGNRMGLVEMDGDNAKVP